MRQPGDSVLGDEEGEAARNFGESLSAASSLDGLEGNLRKILGTLSESKAKQLEELQDQSA